MFSLPTLVFDLLYARMCNIARASAPGELRTADLRCLSKLLTAAHRHLRSCPEHTDAELKHAAEIARAAHGAATRHLRAAAELQHQDPDRHISNRDFAAMSLLERALKLMELLDEAAESDSAESDSAEVEADAAEGPSEHEPIQSTNEPGTSFARRVTKRDLKRADRKARRAAERDRVAIG